MADSTSSSEVYYFLQVFDRVAGDDVALRRRIESLSPDERRAVAHEVVEFERDMENDATGRALVKEAIRRALPHK
ncbi:hypothetical protein MK786_05390 [Microbacterium sp. CFH 31415]|uniref:hypothetical protein n=1 Tax=Microbacterium sp. CFH 31415 TaxID=2921732 RepID=UPI001F12E592|nr:hypothetical protein [Microbacterium sp. CFH 31415]MCH6230167.1 hypothetical protein [Microbacterium sp. CFH 31415]